MQLGKLIHDIERLEKAITITDEQNYKEMNNYLWGRRNAFNMAATYLIPNSPKEALFLHGLIDEYTQFVDDEPTRESDRDDAFEAIFRMNQALRDYTIAR